MSGRFYFLLLLILNISLQIQYVICSIFFHEMNLCLGDHVV